MDKRRAEKLSNREILRGRKLKAYLKLL